MDECEYILLFSDHKWFTCYETNVDEMITTYNYGHPNVQYVFVIYPDGLRMKIDL